MSAFAPLIMSFFKGNNCTTIFAKHIFFTHFIIICFAKIRLKHDLFICVVCSDQSVALVYSSHNGNFTTIVANGYFEHLNFGIVRSFVTVFTNQ